MAINNQGAQAQRRSSRGRQKIEIKKVEINPHRHVTFSKRKNGLFKKATELSTLCGCQLAIILFSEHNKVFSCGRPDVDSVLNRYLQFQMDRQLVVNNFNADDNHINSCLPEPVVVNNNNTSTNKYSSSGPLPVLHASTTPTVQEQEYVKSLQRLEEGKRIAKTIGMMHMDEVLLDGSSSSSGGLFWWDLSVDGMEKEEVQAYKESMQELKKKVLARLDVMAARSSASESGIISQFIDQGDHTGSGFVDSLNQAECLLYVDNGSISM